MHLFPIQFNIGSRFGSGSGSGRNETSTFQVALVYNNDTSFVFFFYDDISLDSSEFNIGFSPSSSFPRRGESFMLTGILEDNDELDVTAGSNTGSPGFYAFQVDRNIVLQPGG